MNVDAGAIPRDGISWRLRAACAGEDLELFFPVGSSGPAIVQIATAKAICARCPVREACLRYAVTTGQAHGIWGGMTEDERRGMRYRERLSGLPGGTSDTLVSTSKGTGQPAEVNRSQDQGRPKHGCTSASHTGSREPSLPRRSMPPLPLRMPRSSLVPSANSTILPVSCVPGTTPTSST